MQLHLSPEDLQHMVVMMVILILSITVHEFGHAIVADWLGDSLPRSQGRVTLNPVAHVDPIGTLALPVAALLFTGGLGFGWGRPVMVNPVAFTRRFRMKTGHMLVAAAGPMMNILFGTFIIGLISILTHTGVLNMADHERLLMGMHNAAFLNFVLAFFNLIPAPPLDGGAVLEGLLPDRMRHVYAQYSQYGMWVAMAFIMSSRLSIVFVWPATQVYLFLARLMGAF